MDRDIRKILRKTCSDILFLLVLIFVCTFLSNDTVEAREELANYQNDLSINVVDRGNSRYLVSMSDIEAKKYSDSIILEVSNNTNSNVNYNLLLRMNKIDNLENYKVMLSGKIYNLNELRCYEDNQYRYFKLDDYTIGNKAQNFTFLLWLKEDVINYDNINISYSFIVDEV